MRRRDPLTGRFKSVGTEWVAPADGGALLRGRLLPVQWADFERTGGFCFRAVDKRLMRVTIHKHDYNVFAEPTEMEKRNYALALTKAGYQNVVLVAMYCAGPRISPPPSDVKEATCHYYMTRLLAQMLFLQAEETYKEFMKMCGKSAEMMNPMHAPHDYGGAI